MTIDQVYPSAPGLSTLDSYVREINSFFFFLK